MKKTYIFILGLIVGGILTISFLPHPKTKPDMIKSTGHLFEFEICICLVPRRLTQIWPRTGPEKLACKFLPKPQNQPNWVGNFESVCLGVEPLRVRHINKGFGILADIDFFILTSILHHSGYKSFQEV